MPQSLILLKKLPDPDYLHNLQAEGVYRASMNFLPGGCYAGAALYDASASYSMPMSATSSSADSCPDPTDTTGCLLWEIVDAVHKVSGARPLEFNAFLFLEIAPGESRRYLEGVRELVGEIRESSYKESEFGREYVAAAHLLGCGSYSVCVEVLADDHDRLLELVASLTDQHVVRSFSVGRLRAADARGFGEEQAAAEAP